MTAAKFRSIALSMPDAAEGAHMGHADFRVGGKIFATLGPDESWGMVKLMPSEQKELLRAEPKALRPASGAWGRQGCTVITLRAAKVAMVREAMLSAWRNVAKKALDK